MIQEVDDVLANSLTAEDEEAVQAELHELQLETVRFMACLISRYTPNPRYSLAYRMRSGQSSFLPCQQKNLLVPSRVRDLPSAPSPTLTYYSESGTKPQAQERERIPVAA